VIAPLRRRHRRLFAVLALALPIGYVGALLSRPQMPRDALRETDLPDVVLWSDADALRPLEVTVSMRRPPTPPDGSQPEPVVALEPRTAPLVPDLLLYWTAAPASIGAALPDGAFLLGAFGGDRGVAFRPCAAQSSTAGRAVLYSLAHQRVTAVAELPAWEGPR
jgi:hypothetical protein